MIHQTKNKIHIILLFIFGSIGITSVILYPNFYISRFANADYSNILVLLFYIPAFLILAGLFEIWIPQSFIKNSFGTKPTPKNVLISFLLGTIIPGPIYVAFPLTASLIHKGISSFNAFVFLGAWTTFKLGEEIFELQFLGVKFAILRILISIPFVLFMAWVISKYGESSKA